MSWQDILKFNPFKARQKRKEEELQREKDRQQRIADDQKRRQIYLVILCSWQHMQLCGKKELVWLVVIQE